MQTASASAAPIGEPYAAVVQPGVNIARPAVPRAPVLSALHRDFLDPVSKHADLLYVSNYASSEIEIFDHNFRLVGKITEGIRNPQQLAVDRFGTLYVCNIGNSTVTEYARGSTSPTKTLSSGLPGPTGIAVTPNRTIYVSNNSGSAMSIVKFLPGRDTPVTVTQAIQFPLGLALDKGGNLFVGAETAGVYEIPSGSTMAVRLKIKVPQFVIGVAIGISGELDVSGQATNNRSTEVDKFKPPYMGAPFERIETGRNALPYYLTAPGDLLFVPLSGLNQVNVYRGQSAKPIATITKGLNAPEGVALSAGS